MVYLDAEEDFIELCRTEVADNTDLNHWYDPIIAYPSITPSSLCNAQWEAM